jgi:plastocyanin
MRSILRRPAAVGLALVLAACGGGGASTTAPGGTSAGSAPCADTTEATVVNATVEGNAWGPVSANVGEVITWTNADSVSHSVALDDGSCAMSGTIPGGGTKSLKFSVAGTFPFHCSVHPSMKGTITIS